MRREHEHRCGRARFVVNSADADAVVSDAITARSSTPALALMPECSAAERNPAGAVTPPRAGLMVKSRTIEPSAMK